MKTVSALAGFLLTSAVALVAHAGQDEVDLVDGSVLQGRIVRQEPGIFVEIQTDDGRVQSIAWGQVKRVSALPPSSLPPAAVAPPPSASVEVHFETGARLGYSFSLGNYATNLPIGSSSLTNGLGGTTGAVPITLDLGMRIAKWLYIGGFFQYSVLTESCPEPAEANSTLHCSGRDLRAGVDLQFHMKPRSNVDPWLGVGFGHEWLTSNMSESDASGSGSLSTTLDGWNFGDVMMGVDMRFPSGLALGPYIELSSGSFQSLNATATTGGSSQSSSGDITSQSSHQWFTLGVRGTFEMM